MLKGGCGLLSIRSLPRFIAKFSHFFQCFKKVPLKMYQNEGGTFHSCQKLVTPGLGSDSFVFGRRLLPCEVFSCPWFPPALTRCSLRRDTPAWPCGEHGCAGVGRWDMERGQDFKLLTYLQGAPSPPWRKHPVYALNSSSCFYCFLCITYLLVLLLA